MSQPSWIIEVGEADFEREVVQRSQQTPVVVDFWAPWCGPCKQLGPILERLTEEHAGEFILAKVDVDQAPGISGSLGIRSVPTVVGFKGGQPLSAFQGLVAEPEVRRFLAGLLPSEADELVVEAERFLSAGNREAAQDRLNAALDKEARHAGALYLLARMDAESGETEQALRLLGRIPPDTEVSRDAERLAAQLRASQLGRPDEIEALEARVAAAPDDLEAQLDLGLGLSAAGRYEDALAILLEVVRQDRRFKDEAARKAMLDVFDILGVQNPTTLHFRSELGKTLFR